MRKLKSDLLSITIFGWLLFVVWCVGYLRGFNDGRQAIKEQIWQKAASKQE